jgi:hypothetical protein
MFTIVASNTTISCAVPRSASTAHRLGSAAPWTDAAGWSAITPEPHHLHRTPSATPPPDDPAGGMFDAPALHFSG